VAGLILRELLDLGCSIDCFVAASREDDDPRALGQREGLTYVISRSRFAFGKWYSRSRLTKMVSLQAFAAMSRRRLAREVAARHLASPYDVLYQFSTLESFGVPRRHRPPVAVHPSVHARGELRWVRREAQLGLSADSSWRRRAIETWLWLRSLRQRRDATRAERVLALSPIFGRELVADYGVDPRRVIVIPNCVDLSRILYSPPRSSDVAVIGRTAVRKGLEDVIALSRLLPDRLPNTHLRVIGSPSLWSDYSKGLASLDPRSSTWVGPRTRVEVLEEIAGSLAVLQLSRYEPFGLTVAEALARGVSVVVTPEVGAGEFVSADVKTVIRAGDIDALVSALVALAELRDDERELLSRRCRTEAERHFSPKGVALQVLDALEAASTPKTARPTHR
jgi:glycosyltransferase involved in cell wall biosynthesis